MGTKANRERAAVMESFEARRLLAANIYNVVGTAGDDEIIVRYQKTTSGDVLSIRVNGTVNSYHTPDAAQIKISGRGGNDTITYTDSQDNPKVFGVLIYGEEGNDTINIGHAGGRLSITFLEYQSMQIDGGSGNDRLVMDGSAISGQQLPVVVAYDYIALKNNAVKQTYFNTETIDIKANTNVSNFRVEGLKPGTTLNLTGNAANNTLTIGTGTLNLVQGRVNFDGVSGTDKIILDDSQNLFSRNYAVHSDRGTYSNNTGSWSAKNTDSLEMKGSKGNNEFQFFSLQAGLPTTVSPGIGTDTLMIGGGNYSSHIKSPVYYWDDTGNSGKVVIDDSADTGDDTYNLSGGQFTKTGGQTLQFAFAKSVALGANVGANLINVTPSTGVQFLIDGNAHSPAGDTLNLNLAPGEVAVREGTGDAGTYRFANKKKIDFKEIENAPGSQNLPTISIDDQVLFEGNAGEKIVTFTAKLSGATFVPVSVDVFAAANTATAGVDFNALPATLTFAAGQTSKTFSVSVYGDSTYESDESFFVNLSNATNATILKGLGIGAIINDDPFDVGPS